MTMMTIDQLSLVKCYAPQGQLKREKLMRNLRRALPFAEGIIAAEMKDVLTILDAMTDEEVAALPVNDLPE